MAKLNREAKQFCHQHGIPETRLFDASELRPIQFKQIMAIEGKWAAYGVSKCRRGHVLRNRHNTCLMCDTKRVAYLLRTKLSGYLYVALGGQGQFMKLGFSAEPAKRVNIANYEGWGGYSDWHLFAYAWAREAGRLESVFQSAFAEQHVPLAWERNGLPTVTREAFLTDLEGALEQLVWLCDHPPQIAV